MEIIDLRSDTVTKPTEEMREAMLRAEVGDDVYGEDPTVNHLQELAAEKMGKEAGLFIPSGTMGNLIATMVHCQRGDEVIMGDKGHTFLYEAGGISALGGIFPHTISNQPDGTLRIDDIHQSIRSKDIHFPSTKLIILENTQNRCGGVILTREYIEEVGELARSKGLKLHMDGARIFNAAIASKTNVQDMVRAADSVTFCLSKGLCAPVGSVLCGTNEFIEQALRIRKMLGGGMRQAGILAAAGVVAIEKMVDRLDEDHRRASMLAEGLGRLHGISFSLGFPQTNMVFPSINEDIRISPRDLVKVLGEQGIKIGKTGERQFRLVTHAWINDAAVAKTIDAFGSALAS